MTLINTDIDDLLEVTSEMANDEIWYDFATLDIDKILEYTEHWN